jgi:CBS-domain-containing membrane protein
MPLDAPIDNLIREAPTLREDQPVLDAVQTLLECDLPALPVVDAKGRAVGVFGEREFMGALFPGWVGELKGAAFVRGELDNALERRACANEPVGKHMTAERVGVQRSGSAVQLVETFLHHRVTIAPILDDEDMVVGVVTRGEFFEALAKRFLQR